MQSTYWSLFVLGFLGIFFSFILLIIILLLVCKGVLGKKYFLIATLFIFLSIMLSLYLLIPCIKDYKYISHGDFFEDEVRVVEFTYVREDLDGNGQVQYSKPKFYIESRNEYIVLNVANVEIGKKYMIRYLPNTKIGEVLNSIEEKTEDDSLS